MSNSFTQVFGGTTIYPADVSYLALALTGNISLEWPLEATAGSSVVARIIDITPSGAYTITMPEATSVSVGQTVLFNNIGPSTVAVNKANGSAILSIGAGEQWQAYLIDNTTPGGTWRTLRYGAATAQAQAAALAGPGLVTDGSQLAQNYEVIDFSVTPYTLTAPDRAKVFIWDGGLGTLNLPSAPAAGDGWFVQVRNAGQGDLTVDPSGSELINAGSTLLLQPGDSAVIVSNGTQWYTIGLGQQAVFAFDYTSIAVTGGTYTLTGSELNRIAYKFTGALASNVTIVVPATVQQYWVNNSTTGPFTLSLQASGSGSSTPVTQSSTSILYCDGTAIVPATTAVTFAGILPVSQGGTGANNAPSARTNLGATGIGSSLFTATSAASARSTISAASSGANSDITSLSGLTTPLSVGQGGTGAATLTANGVVVGNGTSAVQVTAAGTTGQVLVGNTGGAPSWATLTGIGVTSFSGGTTGLTPASPTTGAITLAGTLGVANGGTGTATAFTAGSVVFAGASGVYSQDNANLFWDNTNDRLGIGTATPAAKLSVAGNQINTVADEIYGLALNSTSGSLRLSPYRAAHGGSIIISFNADGSAYAPFTTSAAYIRLQTDGTERMRIDTNGNVGIGTATPTTILQASYSGSSSGLAIAGAIPTLALYDSSGTTGTGYLAQFNADTFLYNKENGILAFGTNNTERMRIDSGGNVGIGTNNPSQRLEVVGSQINTVADDAYAIALNATTGNIRILPYASTYSGSALIAYNAGYTGLGPFTIDASRTQFFTNSAERMRITSAGFVGIGTTTPAVPLDVRGTVSIGTASSSYLGANYNSEILAGVDAGGYYYASGFGAASNIPITMGDRASYIAFKTSPSTAAGFERMRITGTGDVGIGTGTPATRLEVSTNTGTETLKVTQTDASGGTIARIRLSHGSGAQGVLEVGAGYGALGLTTSGPFVFSTDNVERMRITSGGQVGVGITTPEAKFTVAGTAGTIIGAGLTVLETSTGDNARLRIIQNANLVSYDATFTTGGNAHAWLTGGTERMRLTLGGNVGIGTSDPQNRVSVVATTPYIGITNSTAGTVASPSWSGIKFYGFTENTSGHNASIESGNSASNDLAGILRFLTAPPAGTPVERMRIDGVGNVGIGTATPQSKLHVNDAGSPATYVTAGNNAGGTQLGVDTAGTSVLSAFAVNALRFGHSSSTTFVENMRLTAAGNLGIGTSAPALPLVVSNAGTTGIEFSPSGGIGGGTYIQSYNRNTATYTPNTNYAASQTWYVGATRAMDLDSSGNVGIGTSSPLYVLNTNYNANATFTNAVSDFTQMWQNSGVNALGVALADDLTARFVTNNGYAIAFNLAATELMRLTNAGYLGLGTASPANAIELAQGAGINAAISMRANGVAAAGELFVGQDSGNTAYVYNRSSQAIVFGTANTERARIDSSGNFLVGTTSATYASSGRGLIEVNGSSEALYGLKIGGVARGYLFHNNLALILSNDQTGGPLVFLTEGTEKARITSAGELLVGTSSSDGYRFKTEGSYPFLSKGTGGAALTAMSIWNNDTAGDNIFIVFSTETGGTTRGSIDYNRAGGLTRYNTTSDYRAKDIIGPTQNSGEVVDALKVYDGKMKGATIERPMLIAHEAQEVVPYAVTGEKDAVNDDGTPKFQQIDVSSLVPLLIAEIQSLRARVAQLEGK